MPGLRDLWGSDVIHCPYCHGYKVRDEPMGVLATGPMWPHHAQLFRQWTADLTLFLHEQPDPTAEEAEALAARGIAVVGGGAMASAAINNDLMAEETRVAVERAAAARMAA